MRGAVIPAVLLALALGPASCSDPVRPDGIAGTYELGFVNGKELPGPHVQAGPSCGILIESGVLVLDDGGGFTNTVQAQQHCLRPDGGILYSPVVFYRDGSYTEGDGTVRLVTGTEGAVTGTVRGLSITVRAPAGLGNLSLTFLRQDL